MNEAKGAAQCVTCAWREQCQKKYSLPSGTRCTDYSPDLAVSKGKEEEKSKPGPEAE